MENNNELDLNLEELDQVEANVEKKLQVKDRFAQLSEKMTLTAREKEAAEAKAKAAEEARLAAEKQAEFYKNFSQLSSKHPEAINFQDQILERVKGGLDTEEATLLVLAKEGKLNHAPAPREIPTVEGGSALTQLSEGDKTVDQLSEGEKLASLRELEKSGELARALRSGIRTGA